MLASQFCSAKCTLLQDQIGVGKCPPPPPPPLSTTDHFPTDLQTIHHWNENLSEIPVQFNYQESTLISRFYVQCLRNGQIDAILEVRQNVRLLEYGHATK